MLTLSRNIGESLIIGHNVKITVTGVADNQASIRIDAPKDVSIHRGEVYERFQREAIDEIYKSKAIKSKSQDNLDSSS